MAYVVGDLEPAVVLWQSNCEAAETIRAVRRASGTGEWVDADTEYEDLLAASEPRDPVLDDDPLAPVLYMYTAAFTGRPRAAMLGHAGLLAQGLTVAMVQGVTPEYVYLNCGPLFHFATFMTTVATFHLGGTNVFTPRTDPQEIARLAHEERCTGALLMPQTMKALDEIEHSRGYDLSSLRSVSSPWLKRPGGYGQTEVTGLLTLSAFGDGPMAPGRAMPMASVRIVDEDDAEVPDGEVGEIVCRGPLAMVGYWRDPEETARRRRGGWHHTNDLGRREPNGTVAFVGPKTELIKTGAENVYPAEVEGALQRHEAVAETVVIGVPDPRWGQSVKAVVKLRDGATATADELIEHVRGLIASYKKPRYVDVVESLPRLASGAVDREAVQAAHGGGGTPGRG